MSKRAEQAVANFQAGNNCAQSVLLAYADVLGLTQEQAAMVSVGFGGGMGRLRLHCGAFSAAVMLAGILEGKDGALKEHRPSTYARVQEIYRRFMERTPEYYAKRPCARVIRSACEIIDEMMAQG